MKKSTALVRPLAALSLAALLAACFTDNDPETFAVTYNGPLAGLTVVHQSSIPGPQWWMLVDTAYADRRLEGECAWKGYLGDSNQVGGQAPSPSLYTNAYMKGKMKAQEYRTEGIILSMDSLAQSSTLTHYRLDIECEP